MKGFAKQISFKKQPSKRAPNAFERFVGQKDERRQVPKEASTEEDEKTNGNTSADTTSPKPTIETEAGSQVDQKEPNDQHPPKPLNAFQRFLSRKQLPPTEEGKNDTNAVNPTKEQQHGNPFQNFVSKVPIINTIVAGEGDDEVNDAPRSYCDTENPEIKKSFVWTSDKQKSAVSFEVDANTDTSSPVDANSSNNNNDTIPSSEEVKEVRRPSILQKIKSLKREQSIKMHSSVRAELSKTREHVISKSLDLGSFVPPNIIKFDKEIQFISNALDENFVFSQLSATKRQQIINAFQKEHAHTNHVIINKGDVGDYFYILESGTVSVVNNGKEVGTYSEGGSFGELALLYDFPRAVSCVASSECNLWKIDQQSFRYCLAHDAASMTQKMSSIIEKIPLFEPLSKQQRLKMVDCLFAVRFAPEERVMTKGEAGEVFYIIMEGRVKVHDIASSTEIIDHELGPGEWFGELAILNDEPRKASVTAVTDCVCYGMSRHSFERTIGPIELLKKKYDTKKYLKNIPIFSKSNFDDLEMENIVDKLKVKSFEMGTELTKAEGPIDRSLYIITKGSILVADKDGELRKLNDGDYFGDTTLKAAEGDLSETTVTAEEDTQCNVLTRDDLVSVIGDINRLGDVNKSFIPSTYLINFGLEQLEFGKLLGRGGYGKVSLVRCKETMETYALKALSKRRLIDEHQVTFILREKNIMQNIDNPMILPFIAKFQDRDSAYLMMPIVPGGDLFKVMHPKNCKDRAKHRLPLDSAIFYSACVLEALDYLHQRNIAHRDLKPENVMIDKDGYALLMDFGLAKVLTNGKTHTVCGTPEYMAPEIILSEGHYVSVDCWAFAIMIYEMLVGRTPFLNRNQIKMFTNIVTLYYKFPDYFDSTAKFLTRSILQRKHTDRLGYSSKGGCEVKEHPFFKSIDWDKLVAKEIKAPWIPEEQDFSDEKYTDNLYEPSDDIVGLSEEEQALFEGF